MPRRCPAVILRAAGILALSGSLACAHAVEIGEIVVRSFIGQPLVADIELTGFAAEGGAVDARLAHPDVFQASNIGMHPVLSSVRMSVMKRDGRQFLHITSIAPVQTQYVHLFLDLAEGGRRSLRAASLPLATDPRPAPPPAPAVAAAPLPVVAAAPVSKPVAAAPAPKPAVPTPKTVAAEPPPKAMPKPAVAKPLAAIAPVPAPAASCPKPRFTDDEIRACATRDYKNAMLSAQIVELEEKVKALQAALDGPPAAPAVAAPAKAHAVAHVASAPPPPIRTGPATKPVAAAPAAAEEHFPWMWIGAGVAALVVAAGGIVMALKRRRKVKVVAPDKPKSNMMGRLKDAMQRDRKPGAPAEVVEPAMET